MKLMSRIIPREMNTLDTNGLDTRLDARSFSVEKSQSNFSSRVVAMFLSRRNKTPIPQSSHGLFSREGDSKDDHSEGSTSVNGKQTNDKAKSSSENSKEHSTASAGSQKNAGEKASTDHQKENGAKSAVENEKNLSNTDNLVHGSQKASNGPISESQKSSNSTASTGPKSQKNPSDAGKSASDTQTNGANVVPEAQKDKDKDRDKDKEKEKEKEKEQEQEKEKEKEREKEKEKEKIQKLEVSKEKGKENIDNNKSTQVKSPAASVNSTNGKDSSNIDVKNAAPPSSAPKSDPPSPISPQEPATIDNNDSDHKGANTEENNSLVVDESAQNQASSSPKNNFSTENIDLDDVNHSVPSLGTDLPSNNPNLGMTQQPDKGSPNENLKDVPPSSLTTSAIASLDSEVPEISAKQTTNDNSHSDVVKWIFCVFGILLFLTIIIYVIRLCFRHRRLGKAESPPPSPLINPMEPMSRGFSNNTIYHRDFNNSSNNFHPFHEEERLRTMEMNKTYGRVI